jgi:lysophospholipase L1-like esterase
MPRVLFVGDSHLDAVRGPRLASLEAEADCRVVNLAVGGSGTHDVPAQLAASPDDVDLVVLSLGTNDCAPWKEIPLAEFEPAFAALLDSLPGRLVYVTPPGVDESRLGADDPTMAGVDRYTDVARAAVARRGGAILETQAALAPLGLAAFVEDGVHLNDAAYDLLLGELARMLKASA